MAVSFPSEVTRAEFRHPAEFEVYSALISGLRDDWVIIPSLELRLDHSFVERELDLLLLHPTDGLVLVEVKSFPMTIESGRFRYASGDLVERDPLRQVQAQRQFLTNELVDLDDHIYSKIRTVIATPLTIEVEGSLPPGLRSEQLWGSQQLQDPDEAIARLITSESHTVPLGHDKFETILNRLAPTSDARSSIDGLRQVARARMERRLEAETKVLESLDLNNRVLVTGGAGSGKTRLALAWARRAWSREERVLLTCFNDPLGEALAEELSSFEGLVVQPFLRYFATAPGLPLMTSQADGESDPAYWRRVEQWALEHFSEITESFDTIVIDEIQDLSPIRFTMLEELLDPEGPQRIMAVGDPVQSIKRTGFRLLTERNGWVRAELSGNNRNAPGIARFLRQKLGGAPASNSDPFASAVELVPAEHEAEVVTAVKNAVEAGPEGETWVLTTSAKLRDHLRAELGLVNWEDRDQGIPCETVYRIKGLDAERIILVGDSGLLGQESRFLLYAGASRALSNLTLIMPARILRELEYPPQKIDQNFDQMSKE